MMNDDYELGDGCVRLVVVALRWLPMAVVTLLIAFWGEPDLIDAIIQALTAK